MKRLQTCIVENCIPTPASCVSWNGGSIDYLGICDGDPLTDLIWEIIAKLKALAGEDIASFDLDSLLEICNKKAPAEVTLLSILTVMKDNQICLKDFITNLTEVVSELSNEQGVEVNLKCYTDLDNLGNALSITRASLDQLVIDNLCNHKQRIESLEGKVTVMQSEIDNIDLNTTVDELSFPTCINENILPTSDQVINTSQELCDLETALGNSSDIAAALSNTAPDLNAEFNAIPNWNVSPANFMENYSNLLLEVQNLRERIISMENTCCAASCKDVELGFSAVYNEDSTGLIIKFTSGAGTDIPAGFVDKGSTGTITDIDGNIESFTLDIVDNYTNNNETDVALTGLNLSGNLTVSISAVIGNSSLTCDKCLSKEVKASACGYCELCAEGDDDATAVIIYVSSKSSVVIENSTTTTTTEPT